MPKVNLKQSSLRIHPDFPQVQGVCVYETGATDRDQTSEVSGQWEKTRRGIDQKVVAKARQTGYKISRVERFRYRCRYFTDSGVIGGKDFVQEAPVK